VIVGGVVVFYLLGTPRPIEPILVSKANTALQIGLAAVALFLAGFGLEAPALLMVLLWAAAATTLVSGASYVWGALAR
jgi:cardiolipin synthase